MTCPASLTAFPESLPDRARRGRPTHARGANNSPRASGTTTFPLRRPRLAFPRLPEERALTRSARRHLGISDLLQISTTLPNATDVRIVGVGKVPTGPVPSVFGNPRGGDGPRLGRPVFHPKAAGY